MKPTEVCSGPCEKGGTSEWLLRGGGGRGDESTRIPCLDDGEQ